MIDYYNDKSLMEKMAIANENSREVIYRERNEYNVYNEGDIVLLTNWISKINMKIPYK